MSPPHGRLGERGLSWVLLPPDPFFGQRYVHILGRRKLYHVVKYSGGSEELLFFVEGLRFPDEGFAGLVSIHVSLLEYMAEVRAFAGRGSRGRSGLPLEEAQVWRSKCSHHLHTSARASEPRPGGPPHCTSSPGCSSGVSLTSRLSPGLPAPWRECVCVCVCVRSITQLHLALCNPVDCNEVPRAETGRLSLARLSCELTSGRKL